MHPDILLDNLTSEQLSEWEAYNKLEPIGEWLNDFRTAKLESTMVNIARTTHGKKGIAMTRPLDFMPEWDPEGQSKDKVRKQSPEEIKAYLLNFAKIHNAQLEKKQAKKRATPPKGWRSTK